MHYFHLFSIKSYYFFLLVFFMFTKNISVAQDSLSSFHIISEIKIIGNKTTKAHIISRELPFAIQDTISINELNKTLERAQSNLMNTLLFNFVNLEVVYFTDTYISVYITVEERWYWWPIPIFEVEETNFNTWWKTKDFDRANYGMFLAKENFRGRKERLVFKLQGGYTEKAEFRYHVPFANKNQTQGFMIGFSYSRNHEVVYNTTDNKRDFLKINEQFIKKEFISKFNYEYRPKLYNTHLLGIQHHYLEVNDTILMLNNDYLFTQDNELNYFSLLYNFKRDKRNFKSYPTKGYFIEFSAVKNGLGITKKENSSMFLLGSYRKYWELSNRFYFATSLKGKYSIERPPFALLSGLGYNNNFVRGYEFYVINGENYAFFKSQLRYALVKDKVYHAKILSAEKFRKIPIAVYPGVFFDAGYVDDKKLKNTNILNNEMLFGAGASLDLSTYYDIVFRVEYSINRMQEHGLFLHFIAPL